MLINPESGLVPSGDSSEERGDAARREPDTLPVLIQRALSGTLPRARTLKGYEPLSLSPLHIQMVLDRALGYKNTELAAKYDMTPARISQVLNHPDAEYLLAAVMGQVADNLTDPRKRLESYAHEAINVKVDLLRTSRNDTLRNRIASDMLDRAGYGAPQNVNINQNHSFSLDAETSAKLGEAVQAARRVSKLSYAQYLVRSESGSDSGDHSSGENNTSMVHGPALLPDSKPAFGASPEELSELNLSDEEAA